MEGCKLTELKVHSQHNCYRISPEEMQKLEQEVSVSTQLAVGTYVVRIRSGAFNYAQGNEQAGEPLVILWLYGGWFKNLKTDQAVPSTWSTLNGYDDTLTLEVLEPTTLCAFFFDTFVDDNRGEVVLSVVKI
ncbi:MAG: hypothetical protein F6J87_14410 [Spirulina sp. SIO3F2]|nr:hypothetical protein [Spirulina sp. SIO3F2]